MGPAPADVYTALPPSPARVKPNPLQTASRLSVLAVHWLQPLVSLGARKVLDRDDLWPVCPSDACDDLLGHFARCYDGRSFALALVKTFRREIAWMFADFVVYVAAMTLQPLLAQAILDFLNGRDNLFGITSGYALAALLTGVSLGGIAMLNYGGFASYRMGANMRSIVMSSVYDKAMRLSSQARQAYTTGEIVTLLSVDAERISNVMVSGPWLVVAPLSFVATIALVAAMFDLVAAASGAALLVVVLVASQKLAQQIGGVQGKLLRIADERVKITAEALHGIRVTKFYAWEEALASRVEQIRAKEVRLYRRFHYLNIINTTLLFLTPVWLGAVILGVYLLRNGSISVTDAFTLITVVNISRLAVSLFPPAIAAMSQARVAFERIDKFLDSDELASLNADTAPQLLAGRSVIIRDASFMWSLNGEEDASNATDSDSPSRYKSLYRGITQRNFTLDAINVEIESGSLVMVVGKVGAGKSSLLNAILGEMVQTKGYCGVQGQISYVAQEAWIQNSSVQENILFESPLDRERYEQVIHATELAIDIAALPSGDQTEIGERGINLSGGQKARVAIARAVYRREYDILMLDDPLSAVDPHVAHSIFENCVLGLAQGKTRILVLNSHYDLLSHADKILVIEQGQIIGEGSHSEIMEQFPHLAALAHRSQTVDDERERVDQRQEYDTNTTDEPPSGEQGTRLKVIASGGVKAESEAAASNTLVQSEDRVKGRVRSSTYRTYFDEAGYNGIIVVLVLALAFSIAQGMRAVADYWQGYWAKQMERKGVDPSYSDTSYAWLYFAFIVACSLLTTARGIMLMEVCVRSASNLHDELFRRVLGAPVNLYFDVTPVGRILNRFSNDLDQVDSNLPQHYQKLFQSVAVCLGCLVVCGMASLWVALSFLPMLALFVLTGIYFKRTSREIKRIEGISRTPVFNLLTETLHGLSTIRAFKMENEFQQINKKVVDDNSSCYICYCAAGRWLAVRLDLLSVVIILVVSLYVVASKGSITPIVAGLSISYSLMLTSMVQWCVRAVDSTDNAMTSVERLLHFRTIPTEQDDSNCEEVNSASWPSSGSITFQKLCLKYRPDLPLVLRGVDLEILGGEKVGICGRTGAGKSSLMVALFRICEFESGSIFIDGVDISKLKLHQLRRSLAIIPQDPVLFSGSLRDNLDPFHDYTDEAIWHALKRVHLADAVVAWGAGVDFIVSERGDSLSIGQRQLVCIARALLRDCKIVVLDEATANVDTATDVLIQSAIQESFQAKTVLTIAHRLRTILHCDKIAVIDAGRVIKVGPPSMVLNQQDLTLM